LPKILYMPVPQSVHLPFIARRLFFMVTCSVSFISFEALHFTQYPFSAICSSFLQQANTGLSYKARCCSKLCVILLTGCQLYSNYTFKKSKVNYFLSGCRCGWRLTTLALFSSISPTISSIRSSSVTRPIVFLLRSSITIAIWIFSA